LLHGRASEFDGLESVELAVLEQSLEILEDWRLSGLSRERLELADGVGSTEDTHGGFGGTLSSLFETLLAEEGIELTREEAFSTREVVASSELDGELDVVEGVADVVDDVVGVDCDLEDLTVAVDTDDTTGVSVG